MQDRTKYPESPDADESGLDLQQKYNRLQARHLRLQQAYTAAVNPPRTPEELERDLFAVRQFIASMSPAQGAVTCAGVYSVAFLQRERDHNFVVKLCSALVERFRPHQALIQLTFDLWTQHAE